MKVMSYYFSTELLRNVFVFFCDVTARICETLDLRKEFRMMGTTLMGPNSQLNKHGCASHLDFSFLCYVRIHVRCNICIRRSLFRIVANGV